MRGVAYDENSIGRKLLPVMFLGPALGMRPQFIAHRGIIGKGPKLKKVIHPVTGQLQPRSLLHISRQKGLNNIRSSMPLLQNPHHARMQPSVATRQFFRQQLGIDIQETLHLVRSVGFPSRAKSCSTIHLSVRPAISKPAKPWL